MNPIVFAFGPIRIQAFTAPILVGALIGAILLLWRARQFPRMGLRWLDAGLGALLGGIVGARAAHVLIEWPYFSANMAEIAQISSGGLAWQGAAFGGLLGGWAMARLRQVPFTSLAQSFTPIVPVLGICTWVGCSAAACAYGLEVRTLADYPAVIAIETPDLYGTIAPRLNLPLFGVAWSVLVLAGALIGAVLRGRPSRADADPAMAHATMPAGPLMMTLAVYSLGTFVIDFFRGDYVRLWFGVRADQILDLVVFGVAATAWIGLKLWIIRQRTRGRARLGGPAPIANAPQAQVDKIP
jgi:prolipoprotein diacylglyceryltransferase